MMALAITTTSALANSNSGLKSAFDELNYSLTEDWNQKDKSFYDVQMKKSYSVGASWNGDGYSEEVYVFDTYFYSDYFWGYTCEEDCYYDCY